MLYRAFLLYLTVVGMMMISTSQARGLANLLVRIDLERRASLAARQTGGGTADPQVPPQCQSICNLVYATISVGCSPSSCCNEGFEYSYFNCFLCIEGVLGLTDYTEPQTVLDGLVNECALTGNNLPKLTFPGQNPNRTLSSNLPSSTAPPSTISRVTVSLIIITSPPYQSTVAPSTSARSSTTVPTPHHQGLEEIPDRPPKLRTHESALQGPSIHSTLAEPSTHSRSTRSSTHSRSATPSTLSTFTTSSTFSTSATSSTLSTSTTFSTFSISATSSTLSTSTTSTNSTSATSTNSTSATSSTLSTSATSSIASSTSVSSLGVRFAQSRILVVTMMTLVEFFYLG